MRGIFSAIMAIVLTLAFPAYAELRVHFLDVGEADCTIIQCDGECMIIDGGNADDSALVYTYLKDLPGVDVLTAVIATHPHEDHIGGLTGAMHVCRAKALYSPVNAWPAINRFEMLLRCADMQGITVTVPKAGAGFTLGGAKVTFLNPSRAHDDLNNDSIVVRLEYGSRAFLFAADAEAEAEADMLASGLDLRADVLRVGHHGSSSSTSGAFLKAVKPGVAIISVGADNDHNHPSDKVLEPVRPWRARAAHRSLRHRCLRV